MEFQIIILVIIVVSLLAKWIYKFYQPRIRGARGERLVARRLRRLNRRKYKVFNTIYLKINNRTTEIDHLIVSIYGIFVIETKTFKGWIHGSERSAYWTQTFYKKKRKFRNPIDQNRAHVYFLKHVLRSYENLTYFPIVVFAGEAKLKNVYTTLPVIYKHKLLKTIKREKTPILSNEEVRDITIKIENSRLKAKNIASAHKKYVKARVIERKKKLKASICPNCGGKLVLRKGSYGKFYGCSHFPKCKFSKSK